MVHLITNHGIVLISHTEIQKQQPGHCGGCWGPGRSCASMGVAGQNVAARTVPLPHQGAGQLGGGQGCPSPEHRAPPWGWDRDGTEVLGGAETRHITCQVFQEIKVSVNPN